MSSVDRQALLLTIDHSPYLAEGSGTVDAIITVAAPADVATIPEVTLRLWVPAGAKVVFLRQVAPAIGDLPAHATIAGDQLTDYELGSWGTEERVYHLHVEVLPAAVGREKLAARITLATDGVVLGEGKVRAIWTDDTALSTQTSRQVMHYTYQAELAKAIRDGLSAQENGDLAVATAKLRRALEMAEASGDEDTAAVLRRVIDVDRRSGTARLRREVTAADQMALDARSTRTLRVRRET